MQEPSLHGSVTQMKQGQHSRPINKNRGNPTLLSHLFSWVTLINIFHNYGKNKLQNESLLRAGISNDEGPHFV